MPDNLQQTLQFLEDLRFNNSREWFEDNRKRYEQARKNAEAVVTEIIGLFAPVEDLGKLEAKKCFFRIYRDVRFSKDKSPYKTNFGIVIGPNGTKTVGRSYYLNIQPGESMVAGGVYDPSPEQLKAIRQAIAEKPQKLQKILKAPDFARYFGEMGGDRLKTPPKGYSADDPAIELLKHKQFLASHDFKDEDLLADDLAARFVEGCRILKPFEGYFQDVLKT